MDSPPLVPDPPLTKAQLAFLRLHSQHLAISWQWVMLESMLRARSDRHGATIWRDELDDLIARGLMTRSHGASVAITAAGEAVCKEKERA